MERLGFIFGPFFCVEFSSQFLCKHGKGQGDDNLNLLGFRSDGKLDY